MLTYIRKKVGSQVIDARIPMLTFEFIRIHMTPPVTIRSQPQALLANQPARIGGTHV